jgi:hypothetical protein
MLTIRDDDRLGDAVALTSAGRLISFDRDAPDTLRNAVTPVGLEAGESILGIDVRPADGRLYALTDRARLYTVDLPSGNAVRRAVLVADPNDATAPFTALAGTRFGVDFNRSRTGCAWCQTRPEPADRRRDRRGRSPTARSPAPRRASTAAGYTSNFAAACRTQLYAIDVATDRLVLQDPPNDGATTRDRLASAWSVERGAARLSRTRPAPRPARDAHQRRRGRRVLDQLADGLAREVGTLSLSLGETVRGFALAHRHAGDSDPAAAGRAVRGDPGRTAC